MRELVTVQYNPNYADSSSDILDDSASLYDTATGFSALAPMTSKRSQATATKLADGRVLIVGGGATTLSSLPGTLLEWFYVPTATAEIFDPKTGGFTVVASMKWPRAGHAAILLPTGQVLVVGGYTQILNLHPDGQQTAHDTLWPVETELYDPDSNSWRVVDDLGYGLYDPKLAMQQDGNVFIAGTQITAAADSQAAMAGNGKLRVAQMTNRGMAASAAQTSGISIPGFFGTAATAPEFTAFRSTQNQGVERYLNAENTPTGLPEGNPGLSWKKDVPSIANRPTRIHLNLWSTHKFEVVLAKKLNAEVQLFTAAGNVGGAKPIDLSAGPIMDGWYPIDFELSASETKPNTKIRISLDPGRLVLPKSIPKEKTEIEIDPKWNQANPITVYLYGIGYNYAGLTAPIYPDQTEMDQVAANLRKQIYEMLPMPWQNPDGSPTVTVIVEDYQSRYCWDETGTYPIYDDSAAVTAPQCRLNSVTPGLGTDLPFALPEGAWSAIGGGFMKALRIFEPNQFPDGFRPPNKYFLGVMPRLTMHSDDPTYAGGTYGETMDQGISISNGHSSVVLTRGNRSNDPWLCLHELGHQLQALHAPFQVPPKTVDDRWPWGVTPNSSNGYKSGGNDYKDANVGVYGWSFSQSNPILPTAKDFMSYATYNPDHPSDIWVSDFFFTMFWEHQMNAKLPVSIPVRQ